MTRTSQNCLMIFTSDSSCLLPQWVDPSSTKVCKPKNLKLYLTPPSPLPHPTFNSSLILLSKYFLNPYNCLHYHPLVQAVMIFYPNHYTSLLISFYILLDLLPNCFPHRRQSSFIKHKSDLAHNPSCTKPLLNSFSVFPLSIGHRPKFLTCSTRPCMVWPLSTAQVHFTQLSSLSELSPPTC